jgi:hypothetical protein
VQDEHHCEQNASHACQSQMTITYKEGEHTYADYFSLEADYVSGKLHPSDLKPAVTNLLNKMNLSMMRLHVMRSECLSQLRLPPPVINPHLRPQALAGSPRDNCQVS